MIPKSWSKEYKKDLFMELLQDRTVELESEIPTIPEIKTLKDYAEKAEYEIEHPDEFNGVTTGYPSLDKYLDGFGKGELIVLSGATSCGKTQLSQCICLNMALQGKPSLFFTFEMPPTEIYKRFRAMMYSDVIDSNKEVLQELPICLDPGNASSVKGLEKTIEVAKELNKIELVVVDHLQFFIKNSENIASEIGKITRDLKMLALRQEIPIILISHIRKLNHKGCPSIDDLKDSSSIGQDADTVIMVWRNQSEEDITENNTYKNRYVLAKIRKNRRKGYLQNVYFKSDDNFYLSEVSQQTFQSMAS
jgi:replicative DNA helicase